MGTRNLTCVWKDGKWKVAQYGQWDGYPDGQGVVILDFLKNHDIKTFSEKLDNVRWITRKEHDAQWKSVGADNSGWVSLEIADKHTANFPENSRDTGAGILNIIYNYKPSHGKKLAIENSIDFANDSLFCEWAYVVDLDTNMFEVYIGFNKNKLAPNDRFYNGNILTDDYYPIKKIAEFSFTALPEKESFVENLTENA